ncbi:hypothetical protein QA640_00025 [Bradyrhizobium sp. CB82]|uniref:hypothetical protein n=1 Tax=Bradyrhizobium sp. CB82 TaxID=3039159 RepID=UPI0024B1B697|nr:hypothetical protein [Bradyrhizobium sp. CB82]WFU40979.1 hypothetical protein QA640_00025 [Bradyrhizobium sp. CB82]
MPKLGWQEKPDGARIAADHVRLPFALPQGPAMLKLGRNIGETSANLVQKNPEAAAWRPANTNTIHALRGSKLRRRIGLFAAPRISLREP